MNQYNQIKDLFQSIVKGKEIKDTTKISSALCQVLDTVDTFETVLVIPSTEKSSSQN